MNILVTSVGSNTSIGVLKELKLHQDRLRIKFFGSDLNSYSSCAGTPWLDRFFQTSPVFNNQEYKKEIIKLVKDYNIGCVIPIHDQEIETVSDLSQEYPTLTYWAVNTPNLIEICNNKLLSNFYAEKTGLKVPRFTQVKEELVNLKFPLIVKPLKGISSNGIEIIAHDNEVDTVIHKQKSGDFFFQEFINDANEYTIDCYCDRNGNFYAGIARLRIETKAGICTKGITENKPELVNQCKKFLEFINYRGASNLQFIEKEGVFYFIEINPRFSGAGILSYKAGLNSPVYTVLEAMNLPLPEKPAYAYGLKMARYWNEVFFDAESNLI